ncbi:DUF6939 family protein [Hamadaea tsunoensis]|uniref:DUF6939 family protein n=1 Tax=Hamadaea tsunoensis TaxID=53368 RepID=UPI00041A6347|nr:hypothetical protein [Hamadaea tsunoensis]
MTVFVAHRRRGEKSLAAAYPGAAVIDVTSRAAEPWVRLSPFFPHGGIPVPFTPGVTGTSVEGIWQGLKVFRDADVDPAKLTQTRMTGIKRSARTLGPIVGHRRGLHGEDVLDYLDARRLIYLPVYRQVLDGPAHDVVELLRSRGRDGDLVLLDYTTNGDPADPRTPLSHAALVAAYLDDRWPDGT